MQVDSNLNSLIQLEKKLEQSTKELEKLNSNNTQTNNDQEKNIKKDTKQNQEDHKTPKQEEKVMKNTQIPIAYSIGQNGISVQNTSNESIVDIKA